MCREDVDFSVGGFHLVPCRCLFLVEMVAYEVESHVIIDVIRGVWLIVGVDAVIWVIEERGGREFRSYVACVVVAGEDDHWNPGVSEYPYAFLSLFYRQDAGRRCVEYVSCYEYDVYGPVIDDVFDLPYPGHVSIGLSPSDALWVEFAVRAGVSQVQV